MKPPPRVVRSSSTASLGVEPAGTLSGGNAGASLTLAGSGDYFLGTADPPIAASDDLQPMATKVAMTGSIQSYAKVVGERIRIFASCTFFITFQGSYESGNNPDRMLNPPEAGSGVRCELHGDAVLNGGWGNPEARDYRGWHGSSMGIHYGQFTLPPVFLSGRLHIDEGKSGYVEICHYMRQAWDFGFVPGDWPQWWLLSLQVLED